MLFNLFARESKRRDAKAKRPHAGATVDRIDPANENIRATAMSTRSTDRTVMDRAPTSAEIATIVEGIEYPSNGLDRSHFAVDRRATNTLRHTPEI